MAKKILVVDDDPHMRDFLRSVLVRGGFEVEVARDGREAVNRYRDRGADLILTDIMMPEMDGLDVVLTLRREAPAAKVIAMSGYSIEAPDGKLEYLSAALRFGCRRALTKPFTAEAVLDAVADVLAE